MSDDAESSRGHDDGGRKATVSCDTMRKRIKEFLATKQMTQTAFLKEIGCNANSLQRFYRLKGAHNGYQNGIYWGAQSFFEEQAKARKSASAAAAAAGKKRGAGAAGLDEARKKKKSGADVEEFLAKIQAVELEDERVFDDCDEVRKKSLEFIAANGITKAAWLRAIGNVNSNTWGPFVGRQGPRQGAGSSAYRLAYLFLERFRVSNGTPKSKSRLQHETAWPDGYPLTNPPSQLLMPAWMPQSEVNAVFKKLELN